MIDKDDYRLLTFKELCKLKVDNEIYVINKCARSKFKVTSEPIVDEKVKPKIVTFNVYCNDSTLVQSNNVFIISENDYRSIYVKV